MYGFKELNSFSSDELLQLVDQAKVFQDIFNQEIKEKPDFYFSPFRDDEYPTCYFEYVNNGILFFVDFGDFGRTHRNCIHAFQDAYKLSSYNRATQLIYEKYLEGTTIDTSKLQITNKDYSDRVSKSPITITFSKKGYNRFDKIYWSQFGITPVQLISDNVFSIKSFRSTGGRKNFTFNIYKHGYAIDFIDAVKIYQPYYDTLKWYTNCHQNHVGNFDNIQPSGDKLLITKSYKDHRVLRNLFPDLNIIWFQNEGCTPDDDILFNLVERYNDIILLYDNDNGGTISSNKVRDHINSLKPNICRNIFIPHREKDMQLYGEYIKDTAEFYKREGKEDSITMLKQIGL